MHGRAWALLYIKLLDSAALHTWCVCVWRLSVFVNIKQDRLRLIKSLHDVSALFGRHMSSDHETMRHHEHNCSHEIKPVFEKYDSVFGHFHQTTSLVAASYSFNHYKRYLKFIAFPSFPLPDQSKGNVC